LLEVDQVLPDGNLIVRNLPRLGKRKVPQVAEKIEPDLVFPALRGADIARWMPRPTIFVLVAQNPEERAPYGEHRMKAEWPRTFGYLAMFKQVLLSRASKSIRQLAERTAFYAMFGIGPYTFARYKTVWQFMSRDVVAAVVSQHRTPFGYKTVIPTKTVALFCTDKEVEAHYLCAVINSTLVREFIKSYSSAGRGFGAPSVMSHVGIPRFDAKSRLHQELAELSLKLHEAKACGRSEELEPLEHRVDDCVRGLFRMAEA
jgi:hypothetical protein